MSDAPVSTPDGRESSSSCESGGGGVSSEDKPRSQAGILFFSNPIRKCHICPVRRTGMVTFIKIVENSKIAQN